MRMVNFPAVPALPARQGP